MNDFDKVGRYLVKRDPAGFLRRLAGHDRFEFLDWIDARRVVLPPDADLTGDLIAALRTAAGVEAVVVELMAAARADTLGRALDYVVRRRNEPPAPGSLKVRAVSAVVVNMTGATGATDLDERSDVFPDSRLGFGLTSRNLRDQSAADLIVAVRSGAAGLWLLPWVPLMRGGGDAGTIAAWQAAASAEPDERERRVLAGCAITLAQLGDVQPAWRAALRGWGVEKSIFLEELRETARREARAEGVRETVLRQGRAKFRRPPTKRQQAALDALADPAALDALAERVLTASSWGELLGGP